MLFIWEIVNVSFIADTPDILLILTVRTSHEKSSILIKTTIEAFPVLDISKFLTGDYNM